MLAPPLMDALRENSLFDGLSTRTIKHLTNEVTTCQLNKKSHLIYCGEPLTHYYYLVRGELKLYRPTNDGEEKLFYLIKSSQFFYETEVFSKKPTALFSVLASQNSTVLQLSLKDLLSGLALEPNLSLNLINKLTKRYHQAINRIDILSTSNASQRFVLYLLELANAYQSDSFTIPLTQKCIAKQLNIAPETLSRIIKKLCETGHLNFSRNKVKIINPWKLKSLLDLPIDNCCCQSSHSFNM